MRIEDSVCVGEESPLVLSVEAVKEVKKLAYLIAISHGVLTAHRLSISKLLASVNYSIPLTRLHSELMLITSTFLTSLQHNIH